MSQRVVIGICTYHRPAPLERLLASLGSFDRGDAQAQDFRIVVVDNDPQEANAEICSRAKVALDVELIYCEQPTPGVTFARNRVVSEAIAWDADFVAFIDDDDIPQHDWLVELLKTQRQTGADLVFGSWKAAEDTPEWALKAGIFRDPSREKALGGAGRYGLPVCASTCNVMVSRRILDKLALVGDVFDHNFRFSGGEDKDFFIRARNQGATLASAPGSIINLSYEAERFEARGLLRRGFKGGCSQAGMARVYGSGSKLPRMVLKSVAKLILVVITLPFTLLHKPLFLHHLYRLGKSTGVLYSLTTRRSINYYAQGS